MSAPSTAGRDGAPGADEPRYDSHPELALAAVLQLLSRFPARRSPALAQTIARHFQVIGSDPRLSDCVRECAARLVGDWEAYALLGEVGDECRRGPLH